MILYHGTRDAVALRREGFALMEFPAQSDFGDFGRAVYLTASRERAASYGEVVEVEVSAGRFVTYDTMEEAYNEIEVIAGGPTCRGPYEERRARSERVTAFADRWRVDGLFIHQPDQRLYEVVVYNRTLLRVL